MTKNATLSAAAVLGADFTWTFGEDASPATSSKHGNMSSDAITYATSGVKTATLDFVYNGSKTTMQCAPLQVNGAAITGCKCTYAAEQVDVAVDGTAAWTVTGCTSQGANITTYTWGGDGVTGDGTAATAVLTEKGQNVTPTLLVGNDDNTQQEVTCDAVKAIDSNIPDYIIEATQGTGAIDIPAGTNTVHIAVDCSQNSTFFCNGEGQINAKVGGTTITGSHYASGKIDSKYCSGSASVEVTLNIAAKCGVY
jgi:hypothetical protein